MTLSIVIPTYNEEAAIGELLDYLRQHTNSTTEIVVADGGSSDATVQVARARNVKVVRCSGRGRAVQMNSGAAEARGDVLYFLHADTFPPSGFEAQLKQAVQQGYGSGCFRLKFDWPHWFLRLNAWFTRFNTAALRFGDQSLFVRRAIFEQCGGFNEQLYLLEDQEIIKRLRAHAPFLVLPQEVTTSARKYKLHGVYRLQAVYFVIYTLYRLKMPQRRLLRVYQWLLQV